MGILQTVLRRHVAFNPANAEHRAAYWRLRTTGRQDHNLRFVLEDGQASVLAMMQIRIADHYSAPPTADAVPILRSKEKRHGVA